MKKMKSLMLFLVFVLPTMLKAQCDGTVPLYIIDLSANADTTWVLFEEDALDRDGLCCSVDPNENCIQFIITLHPNAAGIFFDYDGAGAFGSLNWQIDCGPLNNLKDTICVSESGPFTLTFCKPGSDSGNYSLISVSKPTFPDDQEVPLNCIQPVEAYGVEENSITWESISPGAPGQYNNLLSCVDCLDPIYSPDPTGPSVIEYEVCGYPVLDYCLGELTFCDTVKFTNQDSIQIDITPINPTFCSLGSVELTALGSGGDGNYNFIWYDGSLTEIGTGASLTVFDAGTYTCELRDGNYEPLYCDGFSKTVTVLETSPPEVNAGTDQVLCADSPIADLVSTVQFATGGVWTGGGGTYSPSNTDLEISYTPTNAEISAGMVVLTFSSTGAGSSCVNTSDDVQLFFIDTIQTDLTDLAIGCFGSEQLISPNVSGGMSPFTYSWTNGVTTIDNNLGIGTHCLNIIDANGCQVTECLSITAPSELDLVMSSTPATTDGGSEGTATVTPSGGTSAYTYLWSNGGTSQTEVGLAYGIYSVTVTDANGCVREQSVVVNEPQCNGFSVSSSSTDVLCNSDSTGTATAIASGGTSPYTYSWNDYLSQSTITATNLPVGVYEVEVTDFNGCISIQTASIFEPDALSNSMIHSDVTIEGGSDGSAEANITGGFGAYDYNWSNSETTALISGLVTDWYTVVVTDDNGCTITDSVLINEPPCDQFTLHVNTVSPLCNGDITGEASLTISNGVGPYSITWSSGETDVLSVSGLSAMFHSVEVTDAQGCYTSLNYGVSEPSALSIGLVENVSTCKGDNNGTIDLTVIGGIYPYYYYSWSNGQTTEDLINLAPDTYSILIEDENGCQATSSVVLVEPDSLIVSYTSQDVTCYQGTDASIDVTVTGGTLTYSYDWSNGHTSEDLTGIDIGGYILSVTDGNFCGLGEPLTVLITEPTVVIAELITVNCPIPGSIETQVDITPNGGNGNYAVSTDGGTTYGAYGAYSFTLNIDQAYNIMVKDINGCLSQVYPITIDPAVVIDDALFNVCYGIGDIDESVTVSVSGGTPDYSISTDNGSSFNTAGVYTLTLPINTSYQIVAQDDNGCLSEVFDIVLPDVFDASLIVTSNYNGQDISCNGFTDGEVTITPSGGSGSYTYLWSNGAMTSVVGGLSAANYSVIVEDVAGCQISDNLTLTEPTSLTQSYTTSLFASGDNISCFGFSNGSIDYTANGGTGAYDFAWTSSDGTGVVLGDEDQTGLTAGTYNVTLTDINSCTILEVITLTQPTEMVHSYTTSTYASSDNISCNGMNDGSINYSISGGSTGYVFDWDNDGTGDNDDSEDLTNLTSGTYIVLATDINGCTLTENIILTQPTLMVQDTTLLSYPSGDNVSCFGFNDGSIDYIISGGSAGYTFAWSTSDGTGLIMTDEDQSELTAGTYDVSATDINGCSLSLSLTLTEPTAMTQSYTTSLYASGDNISCFGYNDGSIDYTIGGGSGGYFFNWMTSNGSGLIITDEDQQDLTAGTYDVVATDINGCFVNQSIELIEPIVAAQTYTTSTYSSGDNISCFGFNDGSIDYSIAGGSTDYTFDWDNDGTGDNDDTEDLSDLVAGTYVVVVTHINGCEITQTIVLNEPDSLMLTGIVTNASCFNFDDASIDITLTGGSEPYNYNWSTSEVSQDIMGLVDGVYSVGIIDENGCAQGGNYTVTEPDSLIVTLDSPTNFHGYNITLFGESDGSIDATVIDGTPGYTFVWSNGETTEDINGLDAGVVYSVIVEDAQGCLAEASIELTQPRDLELPSAFSPNNDFSNDTYVIRGIDAYPNNTFKVFNRWGNLVYETSGYNNTWGGENMSGELIPDGVYYVLLDINSKEIERQTYVHIKTK